MTATKAVQAFKRQRRNIASVDDINLLMGYLGISQYQMDTSTPGVATIAIRGKRIRYYQYRKLKKAVSLIQSILSVGVTIQVTRI